MIMVCPYKETERKEEGGTIGLRKAMGQEGLVTKAKSSYWKGQWNVIQ